MEKAICGYPFKKLLLRSFLSAVFNSSFGCLFFSIIDGTRSILIFGGNFNVQFFSLTFMFGSLFSFLPALIGSCLLDVWLHQDSIKQRLTGSSALLKGMLIGGVTGFGLSLLVCLFVLIISKHGLDFWLFAFRTLIVTLIALVLGGWSGRKLFHHPYH